MDSLKRTAIILELIERMKERGSWCGETHIQKCGYFLQEMMAVPMGFDFILYKHGPFSFDLRDELTAMRADNLLALHVRPYPYGPSLLPGTAAETVMKSYPKTRAKYKRQIDFVVKTFALKGVAELERLATAFYITREQGEEQSVEKRAEYIHCLKPHVPLEEARLAVEKIDSLRLEAEELLLGRA
ncbi:MAG TPA: hypothetical protein GXX19_00830 [Syntrophomonadaceae bacterium]|nr:hypothetical protein [Syntrophomonadaceae bacterium]